MQIYDKQNWYKANLHAHTTLSDGHLTPPELKEAYKKQGYSIVAYTDHRHYAFHQDLCDENFIALAALEIDINGDNPKGTGFQHTRTYHINLYDTDPSSDVEWKTSGTILPERRYDVDYINGYIAGMNARGFLACYNHPYWSLQDYDDYKDLKGFWAMEIFNYGCEHDGLYGYAPQSYADLLRRGERWNCVATDDNHNSHPFDDPRCDSFGGYIMLNADALDYGSVIEALRAGRFYSSMGPEIKSIDLQGNKLHIVTSPVEKIFVHNEGRRCNSLLAKKGETVTEATFDLMGTEEFVQIQLRDGNGLYADSNAIYLR